jgi:DNA ligase-associated metallophosphoesterase
MAESAVNMRLGDTDLVADLSGALWWPAEKTLAFADLHFEKGSSFAVRGKLVPPYDTRATLGRMLGVILRYSPARVICLGDSFHDLEAAARMAAADTKQLKSVIGTVDWTWIAGNHDPEPPADWGGEVAEEICLGPLTFRHEAVAVDQVPAQGDLLDDVVPVPARNGAGAASSVSGAASGAVAGEISGHFHPKASVRAQGRRVTRPCFVTDGARLILPAFGAFTGGLRVTDIAIRSLFPNGFTVHMLGREGLFSFPSDSRAFGR